MAHWKVTLTQNGTVENQAKLNSNASRHMRGSYEGLPQTSRCFRCYALTYKDHNVLHVIKLLRVQKGSELVSSCNQVTVHVGGLEPPLVSREHLLKAELVFIIFKLLWVC